MTIRYPEEVLTTSLEPSGDTLVRIRSLALSKVEWTQLSSVKLQNKCKLLIFVIYSDFKFEVNRPGTKSLIILNL